MAKTKSKTPKARSKTATGKVAKAGLSARASTQVAPKPRPGRGRPVLVAGRTLGEIARAIGVTPSYISRLHLGKRTPSVDVLDKLAAFLKMNRDEVLQAFSGKRMPETNEDAATEAQEQISRGEGSNRPTRRARRRSLGATGGARRSPSKSRKAVDRPILLTTPVSPANAEKAEAAGA